MSIYGTKQILTSANGAVSLTLDNCDFNASQQNKLGYLKRDLQSNVFTVNYNFFNSSIISGGRNPVKKEFEWDLSLTTDKAFTLKALVEEQRFLVEEFQSQLTSNSPTYPQYYIELVDGRLADLDRDSKSRSYDTATAMGLTLPTSPVAGYSYQWYRYLIAIQEVDGLDELFIPDADLINVRITAQELDLATVANFPVTDLL